MLNALTLNVLYIFRVNSLFACQQTIYCVVYNFRGGIKLIPFKLKFNLYLRLLNIFYYEMAVKWESKPTLVGCVDYRLEKEWILRSIMDAILVLNETGSRKKSCVLEAQLSFTHKFSWLYVWNGWIVRFLEIIFILFIYEKWLQFQS